MSEKKEPSRTSDAERTTESVDGTKGLERLADLTRRIVHAGKVTRKQSAKKK